MSKNGLLEIFAEALAVHICDILRIPVSNQQRINSERPLVDTFDTYHRCNDCGVMQKKVVPKCLDYVDFECCGNSTRVPINH